SAQQIQQLGQSIRRLYPLSNDCEITLEGRINRFSDEMFESALEGGFNRFSFGIQSFNTQVRRSAKRLDDREVVLERITNLSEREEAPIVLDLLYGLPYQTLDVFEQDLHDFVSTGAQGI
ncbi:radical SAM protein, partial [Vibrio anguillarum]|uniref:radical SAM protein n=3 Tax=Vibrio TaxID=662 RepID=UPI002E176B5A